MDQDERAQETRRGPTAPGPAPAGELVRRVREGDAGALGLLLRRHRDRLRRIVAVRLAVRLARVLEQDELPDEVVRGALANLGESADLGEAEVVRWMARLIEREVRRRPEGALGETRESARTLRLEDEADPRQSEREDRERQVDARVAELEPAELREVLLLRDYCGADWELVRARLGLLSVEAAQELYRRAHARLARRLRPQMRRQA